MRLVQRDSSELTGSTLRATPLGLSFGYEAWEVAPIMSSQYVADMQGLKNDIVEYILRCCPLSLFLLCALLYTVLQVCSLTLLYRYTY